MRPADARGVRRLGGRPRAAPAAHRDGALRGRPAAGRRPARPPAAAVARPGHRARLGEHARQLLPRAGRPGPRLARGRPRPRPGRPPGPGRRGVQRRRRVHRRRSGRPSGATPSACRRTRTSPQRITEWQPTSLRTIPGILFFASAAGRRRPDRAARRTTAWPTLAWLGVFFVIGAFAIRGVAWWPLGAVAAIAGTLVVDRPRTDHGTRSIRRSIRRAQRWSSRVILVAVGIALLPVWRPIDPACERPVGRRRERAARASPRRCARKRRPGDRLFNAAAVGLVVRVQPAGAPGRDRLPDRALPGRASGTTTSWSSPAPTAGRTSCGPGA